MRSELGKSEKEFQNPDIDVRLFVTEQLMVRIIDPAVVFNVSSEGSNEFKWSVNRLLEILRANRG